MATRAFQVVSTSLSKTDVASIANVPAAISAARAGARDGTDLDPVERSAAVRALGDQCGDHAFGGRAPEVVDDDDGRGVLVSLAADGRRLTEQLEGEVVGELLALLAPVPEDERERLTRLAIGVVQHHAAQQGVDVSG